MAREAGIATKPIRDDLDPKRGIVAWYNVAEPKLTYADEDGNTPAEPTGLVPIPDPEDPDGWVMKEVWSTPENHKKYFGDTYKRLEGADSAGKYVVKEKKEWDDLQQQIAKLEEENAELRKRPASGGTGQRRKYGTGPARSDSKHKRIWLHMNGHEVTVKGRFTDDQNKAFDEANPSGKYQFTEAEEAAFDKAMGNAPADPIPFEDDHASQSEKDAAARVRAVPQAPEAQDDETPGPDDDEMRNLLREDGEKIAARKPLTSEQVEKANALHEAKLASASA